MSYMSCYGGGNGPSHPIGIVEGLNIAAAVVRLLINLSLDLRLHILGLKLALQLRDLPPLPRPPLWLGAEPPFGTLEPVVGELE